MSAAVTLTCGVCRLLPSERHVSEQHKLISRHCSTESVSECAGIGHINYGVDCSYAPHFPGHQAFLKLPLSTEVR